MPTWIGARRLAVIPAVTNGAGSAPMDFRQRVSDRIFYDPAPNTGIDRSLRRYLHDVSYGRAGLNAEIFDPVTITWALHGNPPISNPGQTMDDAIAAAGPHIGGFQYVMVVFPPGIPGIRSWAFWGGAQAKSYVFLDNPIGAWAMELLHMVTEFGDLYNPPPGRAPSPGTYDEMDAAAGTHPSAFTKLRMGWLDAAAVATVGSQLNSSWIVHPLARLQPPPPGRVVALKVPINDSSHYLLVEAREQLDVYERNTPDLSSGIPGDGVVIFDVDESIWPPLWLRTNPRLGVGGMYTDHSAQVTINIVSHLNGGGYQLNITSTRVTTTVPDVRESSRANAANMISAAGLVPVFTGATTSDAWVSAQSPKAGVIVDRGSTVKLQLRKQPIP